MLIQEKKSHSCPSCQGTTVNIVEIVDAYKGTIWVMKLYTDKVCKQDNWQTGLLYSRFNQHCSPEHLFACIL